MKRSYRVILPILGVAAGIFLSIQLSAGAPKKDAGKLQGFFAVKPWKGGNTNDALVQSAANLTIPMASFSVTASKDNRTYTDTIVGRSPFARGKTTTPVEVMIVPLIVQIDSTHTFDPTEVDTCTAPGTQTTLSMFQNSPIFQNVAFDGATAGGHGSMMSGVNVGTTTYNDAFRRAEFWSLVGGTSYHTSFNVTTSVPWTIDAATVASIGGGATSGSGCTLEGALYLNPNSTGGDLDDYLINTVIPTLGIQATTFPIFLMKNVVMSEVTPPSFSKKCCVLGYHGATGSPVQTYAPVDFNTSGVFSGVSDISVAAHEVGEWIDDPLGNNPTPAWGRVGQVSACQSNLETGDPLSGSNFPAITMPNAVIYHPQQLAYFSWFYNSQSDPSVGAAGGFSNNGTFTGPAKVCPPGGSF